MPINLLLLFGLIFLPEVVLFYLAIVGLLFESFAALSFTL